MKEVEERLKHGNKYQILKHPASFGEKLVGLQFGTAVLGSSSREDLYSTITFELLFALYALVMASIVKDLIDLNIIRSKLGITQRKFGNHGSLDLSFYRGKVKGLSDGTMISSGSVIGIIDLTKRIRTKRFSSLGYLDASRELLRDFLKAMIKLSKDISAGKLPEDVVAISGTSHLVGERIVKKMGFDVQEPALMQKIMASGYGLGRALQMGNEQNIIRMFRKKWRRTHSVWMSRQKIGESLPLFEELLKEIE